MEHVLLITERTMCLFLFSSVRYCSLDWCFVDTCIMWKQTGHIVKNVYITMQQC